MVQADLVIRLGQTKVLLRVVTCIFEILLLEGRRDPEGMLALSGSTNINKVQGP